MQLVIDILCKRKLFWYKVSYSVPCKTCQYKIMWTWSFMEFLNSFLIQIKLFSSSLFMKVHSHNFYSDPIILLTYFVVYQYWNIFHCQILLLMNILELKGKDICACYSEVTSSEVEHAYQMMLWPSGGQNMLHTCTE